MYANASVLLFTIPKHPRPYLGLFSPFHSLQNDKKNPASQLTCNDLYNRLSES